MLYPTINLATTTHLALAQRRYSRSGTSGTNKYIRDCYMQAWHITNRYAARTSESIRKQKLPLPPKPTFVTINRNSKTEGTFRERDH